MSSPSALCVHADGPAPIVELIARSASSTSGASTAPGTTTKPSATNAARCSAVSDAGGGGGSASAAGAADGGAAGRSLKYTGCCAAPSRPSSGAAR